MENGPKRFALFKDLNTIIREDVPIIVRYNAMRVGMVQKWVGNLKRHILYNPPLKYVDIDMKAKTKG